MGSVLRRMICLGTKEVIAILVLFRMTQFNVLLKFDINFEIHFVPSVLAASLLNLDCTKPSA